MNLMTWIVTTALFSGLIGCTDDTKSSLATNLNPATKSFEFEVIPQVTTDSFHHRQDSDEDGILDFDEAFGFHLDCAKADTPCRFTSVAVRLSRNQLAAACSLEPKADEREYSLVYQAVCKEKIPEVFEELAAGGAYIRIGELFKIKKFASFDFKKDPLNHFLRTLKQYPKDTRTPYIQLAIDPLSNDTDGDGLDDFLEMGLSKEQTDAHLLYTRLAPPGNRPHSGALPIIRLIPEGTSVAVNRGVSDTDSDALTITQSSKRIVSGNISFTGEVTFGNGKFPLLLRTGHTLAFSTTHGYEYVFSKSEAKTLVNAYGDSMRPSQVAKMSLRGRLANIGSAPIAKSVTRSVIKFDDLPVGEIDFKMFASGTQGTLAPGQSMLFARGKDESPKLKPETYDHYLIGLPMQFDTHIFQGAVYETDDYSNIRTRIRHKNAILLWDGLFGGGSMEQVPLLYQAYGYAGGIRTNGVEKDGAQLPQVPVTLKDLLVALLGFEEVYYDDPETGQSYLLGVRFHEGPDHLRNAGVIPLEDLQIITHFASHSGTTRNPWLTETEGRTPYLPKNQALLDSYQKSSMVLQQIIRPRDRFFIGLKKDETAIIIHRAHLVRKDLSPTKIVALIQGQDFDEVILEVQDTKGSNGTITLEPQNSSQEQQIFTCDLPEGITSDSTLLVRVRKEGQTLAEKLVTPFEAERAVPSPTLLPALKNLTTGTNPYLFYDRLAEGVPLLQGFWFKNKTLQADRPVRGLTVMPSPYVRLGDVGARGTNYWNAAFYDKNGDDPYDAEITIVQLPFHNSIQVDTFSTLKGAPCAGEASGCRYSLGALEPGFALALVGFELERTDRKDQDLRRVGIRLEEGPEAFVTVHFQGDKAHEFHAQVVYAKIPEEFLIQGSQAGFTYEASGQGYGREARSTMISDQDGIRFLKGFDLEYPDTDRHVQLLGIQFHREESMLQAVLQDDTDERDFRFQVSYGFLKN